MSVSIEWLGFAAITLSVLAYVPQITHLIKEHCQPVNAEDEFEEMLNECYDTVKVGCCQWEAGYVMKELDPVAFRCGVSDYFANDDRFVEVDGEYYGVSDIEDMVDELTD